MTLKEICEIMAKNRRGVNFTGKHKQVHPIITSHTGVTIKFEWADPFAGWTGTATLKTLAWDKIIPAMSEVERQMYNVEPVEVKRISETVQCPMIVYDTKTRTMTMYFASDSDLVSRLLHHTILNDDIMFMNGFDRIDNLTDACAMRVISHKTALNTGHPRRYTINEGETRGQFLRRIADDIAEMGYTNIFTEVVHFKNGNSALYFWVHKNASHIKSVYPTSARQAEITQLMLNSKFLGVEACTKVWDFLYNAAKTALPGGKIGDVSDGYHTFNELYHHRAVLFATLCNLYPDYAWKSKQHDDPNFPMYDGMFICGINTPDGQATYHYDIDPYWDMFDVPEIPRAPKFDGHTPAMVIERIRSLNASYAHPTCTIKFRNTFTDECDKHLLAVWKKNSDEYDVHTEFYIDGTEFNGNDTFIVPFRYPGATRGHVTINGTSGRVLEVKFYATAYEDNGIACYMDTISSLIVEWEGGLMPKLAEYCRMRRHGWVEVTTDGCKAR